MQFDSSSTDEKIFRSQKTEFLKNTSQGEEFQNTAVFLPCVQETMVFVACPFLFVGIFCVQSLCDLISWATVDK